MAAPDLATSKTDFIIENEKEKETQVATVEERRDRRKNKAEEPKVVADEETDEFDLSDITHRVVEQSREDIIAAAEAAAFSE